MIQTATLANIPEGDVFSAGILVAATLETTLGATQLLVEAPAPATALHLELLSHHAELFAAHQYPGG